MSLVVPLSMQARSLLRQSQCPQCAAHGYAPSDACESCTERTGVIEELLSGPALETSSLEEIERWVIEQRCQLLHNNRTLTATSLGISIKTLYNKLHRYQLFQRKAS
jgi:DNA-binding NtrC family response regulator